MADISPIVRCVKGDDSIAFLTKAFGLEEGMVHRDDQGKVVHAELWHGSVPIMLGAEGGQEPGPAYLYVVVEDADAHHERAVGAGAEIVTPLRDTDYGSRDYSAKDIDGNVWYFGTYRPAKSQGAE
jgi:uncharacterized glyoxalase superfamily protein PhnB